MVLDPVPMGERRSSGMSAPHSTYPCEGYLLVDVKVADVKEGCALGVVIEYLDEKGTVVAADNVSDYNVPRAHRRIVGPRGCAYQIKWILTGTGDSSTFGVSTDGISSLPIGDEGKIGHDPVPEGSLQIDLTTMQGLRAYLRSMERGAA